MTTHARAAATVFTFLLLAAHPTLAQDDVADVTSHDLRAQKDDQKRYFLIEPPQDNAAPKEGRPLLIIMPGGAGGANMHPFIKRIYKNALPKHYLVAQPVSVKWTDGQKIVWPTKKTPVPSMRFTTEQFVESIVADVAKRHKLDARRIYTLSWSSSGPAAYAISLTSKKITGSFIAMSVYNPRFLPPIKSAKDHPYYLLHSPDDPVCPYRMAQNAQKQLIAAGAKVELQTYPGGHGWRGNPYQNIRDGVTWLEKQTADQNDASSK